MTEEKDEGSRAEYYLNVKGIVSLYAAFVKWGESEASNAISKTSLIKHNRTPSGVPVFVARGFNPGLRL
jgi:hypothetical protein